MIRPENRPAGRLQGFGQIKVDPLLAEDNSGMKDKVGIYYYPFPENKRVRMYVREKAGRLNSE
jgi:hypothetical protein